MAKWIAFDDETVSVLSRQTGEEAELGVGDPLAVALASQTPTLVMLPGANGQVTVLTIAATSAKSEQTSQRYIATGFLGLSDAVATDEDFQEEERPWWRRILPW